MGNKHTTRVSALAPFLLKGILLLFLPSCITLSVQAQNVSKYYTSLIQENNTLYFILPQEGFHNKERNSHLTYDITYSSKMDSVTLNFSYYDMKEVGMDSIEFIFQGKRVINSADRIFVEADKKNWHYRYTTKVSLKDIELLFSTSNAPKINLHASTDTIELLVKPGKWKQQRMIIHKILKIIRFNQS